MKRQRGIIVGLIIMMLLASAILTSCSESNVNLSLEESMLRLSKLVENERFEDLSLTIYYMNPFLFTALPIRVCDIVRDCYDYKTVVGGDKLEKHVILLTQIGECDFITVEMVEHDYYIDARLHYVFKSRRNGELLNVTMWGYDKKDYTQYVIVNGVAVEPDDAFYDLVMPFLPENAAKDLENYIMWIRREWTPTW